MSAATATLPSSPGTSLGAAVNGPDGSRPPGFANAATLSGTSVSATAFPTLATAENGEPAHVGAAAAKSLWWTWTAPANGAVLAETTGSGQDTRLAIYTGTAVGSLTPVAANDDATVNGGSRVQFNAVAAYQNRVNNSKNLRETIAAGYLRGDLRALDGGNEGLGVAMHVGQEVPQCLRGLAGCGCGFLPLLSSHR